MGYKIAALKLLIIVPNLIFFVSGCYMVYKATQGLIEYRNHGDNKDVEAANPQATLAIALSVGMFQCIVSFIAFCGALADKRGMLKAYAIILFFAILLQIIAVIMIFEAKGKLEVLKKNLPNGWEDRGLNMDTIIRDYSIGLIVFVCLDIILALAACFLASKLNEEYKIGF